MTNFDYTFGMNIPKLKEFTSTEKFKLSEKLLDFKYKLNISEEEMAKILEISKDEYLNMEFCVDTIPIEKYKNAVKLIDKYYKKARKHLCQ